MKVLHVIPAVAPRYGGPSVAVAGYCRALARAGVQTTIATTNADGDGVLPVPIGEPVRHVGTETWFFPRRGEAFKYSAGLSRWLDASVSRFDAVHIHAVFSHASIAAGRAARRAGVPYIVRPLGSLDPWSLAQNSWKKRLLLWSAAGSLLEQAAGIHFTTSDEARLAAPVAGKSDGRVVPLGIEDSLLDAPLRPMVERTPEILAITRFHPKKNLDALIRAFHSVAGAAPFDRWRLTIAGAGDEDYKRQLVSLAKSGPASDRVEVLDWIEGDEKTQRLLRASIFAVPSHQENFGLALVEALASGLPAIVSGGVNLSFAIADAGAGWISGTDDESIAAAIRLAMGNSLERERRARNARDLARGFTWAAAADQLIDWYGAVAAARSVGARS